VRVLVVSGIWPPDVGGPASHAPQVAGFLHARGHDVEVVVTADARPLPRPYPVGFTPRRLPVGVRHLHAAWLIAQRARRADVVYTTGMFGRTGVAAALVRRPYVVKLTGDPAFERLRARGTVADGDVAASQRSGGLTGAGLRRLRDAILRRAAHVLTPSAWLRDLVVSWGVAPERVSVLPNPAPALEPSAPRDELRRSLGLDGHTLVFAGRLTAQKDLGVLLAAVARVGDVALVIAGEGPERGAVARRVDELGLGDRVRMLGPQPRERVVDLFAAADAVVLSSRWENFPHALVEALDAGTPVLSTAVGGVEEVVTAGVNGLLVPPGDVDALAGAIRRFLSEPELENRLRAAAAASVERYRPETILGELEAVLLTAAAR
jgi:glycosyltransferase involved in cell wall biosynthesis